jgi:hypothetical protein
MGSIFAGVFIPYASQVISCPFMWLMLLFLSQFALHDVFIVYRERHLFGSFGFSKRIRQASAYGSLLVFLQRMHLSYGHNNVELSSLGMEAISMLTSSTDAHAQVLSLQVSDHCGKSFL